MIEWNYKTLATLNNVASETLKKCRNNDKVILILNRHFLKYISKALLDNENIPEAAIYSFNYTYITLKHYYHFLIKNPDKIHPLNDYKEQAIERLNNIKETTPIYTQTKLNL